MTKELLQELHKDIAPQMQFHAFKWLPLQPSYVWFARMWHVIHVQWDHLCIFKCNSVDHPDTVCRGIPSCVVVPQSMAFSLSLSASTSAGVCCISGVCATPRLTAWGTIEARSMSVGMSQSLDGWEEHSIGVASAAPASGPGTGVAHGAVHGRGCDVTPDERGMPGLGVGGVCDDRIALRGDALTDFPAPALRGRDIERLLGPQETVLSDLVFACPGQVVVVSVWVREFGREDVGLKLGRLDLGEGVADGRRVSTAVGCEAACLNASCATSECGKCRSSALVVGTM
jgi:hypothetical protein